MSRSKTIRRRASRAAAAKRPHFRYASNSSSTLFGQQSAGGLSIQCLTGPTITKKMHSMTHIDRRICCAPMMDDVERQDIHFQNQRLRRCAFYTSAQFVPSIDQLEHSTNQARSACRQISRIATADRVLVAALMACFQSKIAAHDCAIFLLRI